MDNNRQWIEDLSDRKAEQLRLLSVALDDLREPLCNVIMYAYLYKETQMARLKESEEEKKEPGYFANLIASDNFVCNALKKLYSKLIDL